MMQWYVDEMLMQFKTVFLTVADSVAMEALVKTVSKRGIQRGYRF